MGKVLMERGEGIISHRLFFLGPTFFSLTGPKEKK